MNNTTFLNSLRKNYEISLVMLEKIIELCPNDLWDKKLSGFIFWQQLIHCIFSILYWFKEKDTPCIEPFKDKNLYPELDGIPETILTRTEVKKCFNEAKLLGEIFFSEKDDVWLTLPSNVYNQITNFDNIIMQMRHIQYHVGHCDAILRANNLKTGEYLDIMALPRID
ncbi:hypothetical protein PilKf_01285 [Pillotina sp. SPG140]|jgi:hypothetical protein